MSASSTLFNIFLEKISTDALEDHEDTVSIGGKIITDLRFADDIDGLAGEELAKLVERLDKAFTAYGVGISAEKTKIKVSGQTLETVTSFKYLEIQTTVIGKCLCITCVVQVILKRVFIDHGDW